MENIDYTKYLTMLTDWAVTFLPKVLIALIILYVGFKIANKLNSFFEKTFKKSGIEPEIRSFLASIIDILLKFVVILAAAATLGFAVSSLLGVLAAAGFAVGLALQGFLGNFASGITIVFFKPYRVGDWVEISEKFGKVESIQIFNTSIITPGTKTLVIPNGQVTDNIITNYSRNGKIKLKLNIHMPYEEDFPKIKQIILDSLKDAPNIMHQEGIDVGILTYDTHFITLVVRPSIHPDHYWDVTFDCHSRMKAAFSENGIKMAYSEGVELGAIGK